MKKLNQKGFTHHLLIVGVAVVVAAAVGFAGFRVYQKKNGDSAKAASRTLTLVGQYSGHKLYACYQGNDMFYQVETAQSKGKSYDKINTIQAGYAFSESYSSIARKWGVQSSLGKHDVHTGTGDYAKYKNVQIGRSNPIKLTAYHYYGTTGESDKTGTNYVEATFKPSACR